MIARQRRSLGALATTSAALTAAIAPAFAQTTEPGAAQGSTTAPTTGATAQQGGTGTSGSTAMTQGGSGNVMTMTGTDGRTVVVLGPNASAEEKNRARWAFYNADRASVNRVKAMGFTEGETRRILNIAFKAGLDTDYVTRRVKVSGYSIPQLAATYGIDARALDDELIGFNADAISYLGGSADMSRMAGTTTTGTQHSQGGEPIVTPPLRLS